MSKHTPGPWAWFGSPKSGFYLATTHSGRRYVMEFVRMGFNSAQPRFQIKGEGMIDGKDLCVFEVARNVVGIESARKPGSGVYRHDIVGFDHADARLIAAAPELLAALDEGRRAIGDHFPPNDCYATGPLTGDPVRDLVECPACSFIAMYDAATLKARGEA